MIKRLQICYRSGSTPFTSECSIFGIGAKRPDAGWEIHATAETDVDDLLLSALLYWLEQYSVDYNDRSFTKTVPTSADMATSMLVTALGGDRLARRAYVVRTRFWNTDEWSEIARRTIAISPSKRLDGHGDRG